MRLKYFISYGTNKFNHSKFRLKKQVEDINIFDEITVYDNTNISEEFKIKHDKVLSEQRGGGFWIWKYDIIKNKLKDMKEGDFLVYLDAGCVINNNGRDRFLEYFKMLDESPYGIMSFQMRHKEYMWTTKQIFDYLNVSYDSKIANSGQYLGGVLIMQKTPHLLNLLDEVYKILDDDDLLFTNFYNKDNQHPHFRDNRHDQSISSVLRKIHGSLVLKDETLAHLPESSTWPIWAKRLK